MVRVSAWPRRLRAGSGRGIFAGSIDAADALRCVEGKKYGGCGRLWRLRGEVFEQRGP